MLGWFSCILGQDVHFCLWGHLSSHKKGIVVNCSKHTWKNTSAWIESGGGGGGGGDWVNDWTDIPPRVKNNTFTCLMGDAVALWLAYGFQIKLSMFRLWLDCVRPITLSFSLPFSFLRVGWRKPKCNSSTSEVPRLSYKIRPTYTLCGSFGWDNFWRWCSEGIHCYRRETWHFAAWPKRDWCNTKYDFDWSIHNLSKYPLLYTHLILLLFKSHCENWQEHFY